MARVPVDEERACAAIAASPRAASATAAQIGERRDVGDPERHLGLLDRGDVDGEVRDAVAAAEEHRLGRLDVGEELALRPRERARRRA